MVSHRVKRIVIVGFLPALLIVGIAMHFSGELELRVTPVNSDEPLLVLPLMPGEPFTVHYYHSVEDAPIWEVHKLDSTGRIFIEEERYLKFGAGMGKMPGVGHMVKIGPFEAIVDMHMPTGDFVLRIGSPNVNHTILWRGTRTNLSAIAPHRAVQFSGRPVSWGYVLWRRFFPHRATPEWAPGSG